MPLPPATRAVPLTKDPSALPLVAPKLPSADPKSKRLRI
jgi:hypothetical protein